jgi:very-short-patch-repair endonuclease
LILESMGLQFLRFEELQVRKDMDVVLQTIQNFILAYEEAHPR